MTVQNPAQPSTSQPAGGPDAPGGAPYPDIADTSHATAAVAAFFRSFFTAKTSRDIEATQAHFHPGKTVYFDATLGWALRANADVRKNDGLIDDYAQDILHNGRRLRNSHIHATTSAVYNPAIAARVIATSHKLVAELFGE